jgi:hypothetical protein
MSQRKHLFLASNDDDLKTLVLSGTLFYKAVDSVFKLMIYQMMDINPKERLTANRLFLIYYLEGF